MKPYKITEAVKKQIRRDFQEALKNFKNTNNPFKFEFKPNINKEKLTVQCLPTAYHKMLTLVSKTNTEVAWHMNVTRTGKHAICITDILVYPQIVTGATVNTDDTKYSMWLCDLNDETFSTLRGQGHSHVNMSVRPSSVDTTYYNDLLTNLHSGFYLFLIMNKKEDLYTQVVDIDNNIIYDPEDINFVVMSNNYNEHTWYAEQTKMLEQHKPPRVTKTSARSYEHKDGARSNENSQYTGSIWDDIYEGVRI